MLDVKNMPCLKLLNVIPAENEKKSFLLSLSKKTGNTWEETQAFIMLQSITHRNSPFPILTNDDFLSFNQAEKKQACSHYLSHYNKQFSKICKLCKRSTRYSNASQSIEQALLSAFISPSAPAALYKKASGIGLKATHFKAHFLFIIGSEVFILPLYRYFYQFIYGPSLMIIDDNLLLDNIDTPNWRRIIDAFLKSRTFQRAIKLDSINPECQSILLDAIRCELDLLFPPQSIDLKQANEWMQVLLQLKTRPSQPVTAVPCAADSLHEPSIPLLSLPPAVTDECVAVAPDKEADDWTQNTPTAKSTPTPLLKSLSYQNGILQICSENGVTFFEEHLMRALIYNAYRKKTISIEISELAGKYGVLFYISDSLCLFGEINEIRYPLKEIISDHSIEKYTTTFVELAGLCLEFGIAMNNVRSISAAYYAVSNDPILYPLAHPEDSHLELKDASTIEKILAQYKNVYTALQKAAEQEHKVKSITTYQYFEMALASSRYLPFCNKSTFRNLSRNTYEESTFTSQHDSLDQHGSWCSIRYHSSIATEQMNLLCDKGLCLHIIASIFSATELNRYSPILLRYSWGEISVYFDAAYQSHLPFIEEHIVRIASRLFHKFHYEHASLTITYGSAPLTGMLSIPNI